MGYETLQTRLAAKELAPRIVVAAIAAERQPRRARAWRSASRMRSPAPCSPAPPPSRPSTGCRKLILGSLAGNIFLTLVAAVVAVLAAVLLGTWLLRLVLVVLLVIAAPLALICHALPATEGLAKLWWRATTGTLARPSRPIHSSWSPRCGCSCPAADLAHLGCRLPAAGW